MIRRAFAIILVLHGLIHLIGFVVPWRFATLDGFPYTTSALWGRLELGATAAQVLGLVWLGQAVAFVVAGVGVWRGSAWAPALAAAAALGSLVVCALGSPGAAAGLVVNIVILIVVGPGRARVLGRPSVER
ncbi:MAG: hypothetical protein A2Z32_06420 [Chloroflexi bacterium RBG_16_69_14]|nr:MAG: hypothetical protein A2Z32_06420 [Chloroflexi bacterium RBG_16_69_14]